ncbi:chemotaxis protein CheR, partial [Pseudomonas sp. HMWF031]
MERHYPGERNSEIELRLLIEAIYLKYSYDFRDYSGASIKRRVTHALSQFECNTISA